MAIITTMNGVPLFDNIGEALVYGAARGLSGYHTHIFQGQLGYMGGATHAQATGTATSNNITPGSQEDRQVINHEMRHATDMKIGKLAYTDNSVTYNGEVFPRETINGKDMIKVDGKWKEAGDTGFPWEDDANNGTR